MRNISLTVGYILTSSSKCDKSCRFLQNDGVPSLLRIQNMVKQNNNSTYKILYIFSEWSGYRSGAAAWAAVSLETERIAGPGEALDGRSSSSTASSVAGRASSSQRREAAAAPKRSVRGTAPRPEDGSASMPPLVIDPRKYFRIFFGDRFGNLFLCLFTLYWYAFLSVFEESVRMCVVLGD